MTENPATDSTEIWAFYNRTADAHPMHVHEVAFEVVSREGLALDKDREALIPIMPNGSNFRGPDG